MFRCGCGRRGHFLADPLEEQKTGNENGDRNPELDVSENAGEEIVRGSRRVGTVGHEFPSIKWQSGRADKIAETRRKNTPDDEEDYFLNRFSKA